MAGQFVKHNKDMINRGGENIYPKEIEMVLEGHPAIVAAAALGEKVKAIIEPSKSSDLTAEQVKNFLEDKLARYKTPEIIEFMEQLPRNPTGKILKKVLKERL